MDFLRQDSHCGEEVGFGGEDGDGGESGDNGDDETDAGELPEIDFGFPGGLLKNN
jgi:hypothetical protein